MRILLVNPPPQMRVDQYDTPDFTRLGLANLAAQLRTRPGHQLEILDAKFERLSFDETVERALRFRPDVVGLTAFTNEIKPAARVAERIKAASKEIRTVIGGVHVSALPAGTLEEFPAFDVGVVGEGELSFQELIHAWDAGAPITSLRGLVHRERGAPAMTAPADPPDFAALPPPAWDLLPGGNRFLVMTQRGCPFACNFCQNPNGRLVRQRPVEAVVAELTEIADRWHPEEITICDEIFTVDRERTHALLDAMIASGLQRRLRWWAQTHVNTVDRDLFAKMKAAGCCRVGLGIETGDREVMKAMRKGTTRERVLSARRQAEEAKLPVEGLFILGHPNETRVSVLRTLDFAAELNPDVPIIGIMVPYPGTEVMELAKRGAGGYRLLSTDWNDYINQLGHALAFEHLSRRELELLQLWGYVQVFLRNRRFAELARFAWQYRSEGWAVVKKILTGKMPALESPPTAPKTRLPIVEATNGGETRSNVGS